MDTRIFFKLRIEIPDLDQFESDASKTVDLYDAELIFDSDSDFLIRVYFDDSERLDRKLMQWDPKYSYSLLSRFKVLEVSSSNRLIHIDFGNYYHKGMESGSDLYEFGKRYFKIRPAGIKLIYASDQQDDSEIYLNQTSFNLIELNYNYHFNLPWKNAEFKWEPTNNVKDFISFSRIEFIPEHEFRLIAKSSDAEVSLSKAPRLRIKHGGLSELEVKEHANALCDLYSLYSNKKIDWKLSRIYAEGKLFVEMREVPSEDNKFTHGIFLWDFIQNPLNLIRNVDATEVMKNRALISQLIERYNYAQKTQDETKFMILYSLLEQLRNQYVLSGKIEKSESSTSEVKEEYQFKLENKEVNVFIKVALEKIKEIIDEKDKELFEKDIQFKVAQVKLLSMTDQFQSYFAYLNIHPETFDLDFRKLKSLRDRIFHGKSVEDSLEFLKKVNWFEHLPRFTGILLFKYLGIADLDRIEKKRPRG